MTPLARDFRQFFLENHLFEPQDLLLLAVSGGVDSMALTELVRENQLSFAIAHCNFGLRGEESDRDERFVRQRALELQVPFVSKRFDTETFASTQKLSIQMAARALRYEWFETLRGQRAPFEAWQGAKNAPAMWILTAHHQDDQVETVLLNFLKGTGISGLRGMLPKRDHLIRPLLFASKASLQQYCRLRELSWVEDRTNREDTYSRNFLRLQLIPRIREIIPQIEENILDNAARFADLESLYVQTLKEQKKKLLRTVGTEYHMPVRRLLKMAGRQTLFYEILKDFGFTPGQLKMADQLLESENSRQVLSATHRLIRNRQWLILAPLPTTQTRLLLLQPSDQRIAFPEGTLQLEKIAAPTLPKETKATEAWIDARALQFPLVLRAWRPGDYFYPLGMRKKKKVARFLIDQKLSRTQKEKVWVLESDKKILWIVGLRIDERFKITAQTREALKVELRMG